MLLFDIFSHSTLSGLVEFDGFYLESDPCLVCNNPEVPFSVCIIQLLLMIVELYVATENWCGSILTWKRIIWELYEGKQRIWILIRTCAIIFYNFFPPEYKTVLHQSGYPVHHHSASCQAHWQSHYQQSHREDWWPQTYKNGPNHQPVLQQQDCTGYCGTEEQVCFRTRCSSFFLIFITHVHS